jgi:hypothetical protein
MGSYQIWLGEGPELAVLCNVRFVWFIYLSDLKITPRETADFFKSAVDSADKITDILNVGRLIFYTAAGFSAILPAAMSLRLLA